ncbi:transcriptional regulator [Paenibacillus sp. GSMTC-2017]|uniref:helix-turn-helix transcriptional regulator n=1 Tax=Paenibacillus sp. GSMTC-2017 TaxID=2794350 RepID=UPI0018D82618|nr:transcriptional regulator [Paenibacillus sp. GSMTC-2017]MBH5316967.1 transcriptional regulator [Paenibacillus sp. GSMTC-2017]
MIDKVIRLINIIIAIQAKPGITASELALKYDVTIRTIYRDIDIISLIAPITSEGRGAGFRFIGHFFMYPLNFSEQEALVFSLLPSVLDLEKLPLGFETAYDKVMSTLNKEKSQQNNVFENIAVIIQTGTPAYRKDSPNYLQTIIQAILEQKTIETVYHSQYRNETKERKIDPYVLVPRDQRFYLIGKCLQDEKVKTFRVSRLLEVKITSDTFHKGDFNIKNHLKNTWSIQQGNRNVTFKVRFSPNVARYIKEKELFVRPRMKDMTDGSILFEVTVNNEEEFIRWVRQYGPEAEILEPLQARDSIKKELDVWMKLYQ